MTNHPKKVGVIGWPISHSLSPLLHGLWLEHYGIQGSYEAIAVAPEDLAQQVQSLAASGYSGWNVTVPHKTAILDYVDNLTSRAADIGAVNLVTVRNGRLIGDNTDGMGFLADVNRQFKRSPKKITILGAGGAAQAIFHACLGYPDLAQLNLINRSKAKAEALAQGHSRVKVYGWDELDKVCNGVDLLVQTTVMGMTGHEDKDWPPKDLRLDKLSEDALVYDIIYTPFETSLMKAARAANRQASNGLGMLIEQARPSFEAFFGIMPDRIPAIDAKLRDALKAR
ncbi:MAG: shikimate dehydrogenase [Sphingomonadales bacterium]|jgi:shikimate dehydrogenase